MTKQILFAAVVLLLLVFQTYASAHSETDRNSIVSALALASLGVAVYASVIFLILAFRESVLWGMLCMLPVFSVVFLLVHWEESKKAFFVALMSWIFFVYGWY